MMMNRTSMIPTKTQIDRGTDLKRFGVDFIPRIEIDSTRPEIEVMISAEKRR